MFKDPLTTLPSELGVNIFARLTGRQLARAQQVSRGWNAFGSDDELWKCNVGTQHLMRQRPASGETYKSLFASNAALQHRWTHGYWNQERACKTGAYCRGLLQMGRTTGFFDYQRVVTWRTNGPANAAGHSFGPVRTTAACSMGDNAFLAVAGWPFARLELWDTRLEASIWVQNGRNSEAHAALSLGPHQFAVAYESGDIDFWQVGQDEPFRVLHGHTDRVNRLALLEDGRLLSGASDGTARVWDVDTGECEGVFQGHSAYVKNILPMREDKIATSSWDRTVKIWDVGTQAVLHSLPHENIVYSLCEAPGGMLVTGDCDGRVAVWDVRHGEKIRDVKFDSCVREMVLVNDTRILALTEREGAVYVDIEEE